jgi:hypothetical protein
MIFCATTFALQMSAFAVDTDALVVTENGNIGIGLTDPRGKLHVKDGHIRVEDGHIRVERNSVLDSSNINNSLMLGVESFISNEN